MSKKKVKDAATDTPETPNYGGVFYTDGGCRAVEPGSTASRGYAGYGMHGYIYSDQPPKKGAGNPTQKLTAQGYVPKAGLPDRKEVVEVKPTAYINAYGSLEGIATNNQAEIAGAFRALQVARDKGLSEVTILTDSEQTVLAANGRIEKWMKTNWLRSNGQPVQNREDWEALYQAKKWLVDNQVNVQFKWVKGHAGNFGNERADRLATLGRERASQGHADFQVTSSPPDGYWSRKTNHHPLLQAPFAYDRTDGGRPGCYVVGNFGFDDEEVDLLGRPVADTWFAYVQLEEANPMVDHIRQTVKAMAAGELRLYCMDLRLALNHDVNQAFDEYGHAVFMQVNQGRRRNTLFLDRRPVAKEYQPFRVALHAFDVMDTVASLDQALMNPLCVIQRVDITDLIWEKTSKGELDVKGHWLKNTDMCVEVELEKSQVISSANLAPAELMGLTDKVRVKIGLTLGVDLADRNVLKKISAASPKAELLWWLEDGTIRFATRVQCQGGVRVQCAPYSNLILRP